MTCTHDPLTLYATASLVAFCCALTVLATWVAIHAADAAWARLRRLWADLGRAEQATRIKL